MTRLRQYVEEYIARTNETLDDLFIAVESRNTSELHVGLATLINLLEHLKTELAQSKDEV